MNVIGRDSKAPTGMESRVRTPDDECIDNFKFHFMLSDEYGLPRGTLFTRLAITRAVCLKAMRSGDFADHGDVLYARERWGDRSGATMILKSGIAAGSSDDADFGSKLADTRQAATEFLEIVRPATIIGKLAARRVPAGVLVATNTGGATAFWRGESKAVRFQRMAFERARLKTLHLSGMIVISDEQFEDESPEAEDLMRRDLVRATVELSDATFIDPSNTGTTDVMPASITNTAVTFASGGILEDDLAAAVEIFAGDFETAAWVLHPRLAVEIALRARGKGVGAALGARGGDLLGMPVITSQSAPYDVSGGLITLVDAAGIALVDGSAAVTVSDQAAVELDTAPQGASDTPTAASATLISLWQTGNTAFKVARELNWRVARPGAVVTVSGCNYGGT